MTTRFFGDTAVLLGRSLRHITRSLDTIITTTITTGTVITTANVGLLCVRRSGLPAAGLPDGRPAVVYSK